MLINVNTWLKVICVNTLLKVICVEQIICSLVAFKALEQL